MKAKEPEDLPPDAASVGSGTSVPVSNPLLPRPVRGSLNEDDDGGGKAPISPIENKFASRQGAACTLAVLVTEEPEGTISMVTILVLTCVVVCALVTISSMIPMLSLYRDLESRSRKALQASDEQCINVSVTASLDHARSTLEYLPVFAPQPAILPLLAVVWPASYEALLCRNDSTLHVGKACVLSTCHTYAVLWEGLSLKGCLSGNGNMSCGALEASSIDDLNPNALPFAKRWKQCAADVDQEGGDRLLVRTAGVVMHGDLTWVSDRFPGASVTIDANGAPRGVREAGYELESAESTLVNIIIVACTIGLFLGGAAVWFVGSSVSHRLTDAMATMDDFLNTPFPTEPNLETCQSRITEVAKLLEVFEECQESVCDLWKRVPTDLRKRGTFRGSLRRESSEHRRLTGFSTRVLRRSSASSAHSFRLAMAPPWKSTSALFVTINVWYRARSFHGLRLSKSLEALSQYHAALFDRIRDLAINNQGYLEWGGGDSATLVWSDASAVSMVSLCEQTLSLVQQATSLKATYPNAPVLGCAAGVARSSAMVGNVVGKRTDSFSVIGPGRERSRSLAALSRVLRMQMLSMEDPAINTANPPFFYPVLEANLSPLGRLPKQWEDTTSPPPEPLSDDDRDSPSSLALTADDTNDKGERKLHTIYTVLEHENRHLMTYWEFMKKGEYTGALEVLGVAKQKTPMLKSVYVHLSKYIKGVVHWELEGGELLHPVSKTPGVASEDESPAQQALMGSPKLADKIKSGARAKLTAISQLQLATITRQRRKTIKGLLGVDTALLKKIRRKSDGVLSDEGDPPLDGSTATALVSPESETSPPDMEGSVSDLRAAVEVTRAIRRPSFVFTPDTTVGESEREAEPCTPATPPDPETRAEASPEPNSPPADSPENKDNSDQERNESESTLSATFHEEEPPTPAPESRKRSRMFSKFEMSERKVYDYFWKFKRVRTPEQEEQERRERQRERWQKIWNFAKLLALVANCINIPLHTGFGVPFSVMVAVWQWVFDALVYWPATAIMLRYHTKRRSPQTVVLVMIASFPIEFIPAALFGPAYLWRPEYRINRLLHLAAFGELWSFAVQFLPSSTNPIIIDLFKYLVVSLFMVHLMSASFHFVLLTEDAKWAEAYSGIKGLMNLPLFHRYTFCWDWAVRAMTGHGCKYPVTDNQYVVTCICQVVGVATWATLIAYAQTLASALRPSEKEYERLQENVKEFLKQHMVTPQFRHEVQGYIRYLWNTTRSYTLAQYDFLTSADAHWSLPPELASAFSFHVNEHLTEKVPLLSSSAGGLDHDVFVADVVSQLKLQVFTPGACILNRGEAEPAFYIVARGQVLVSPLYETATAEPTLLNEGDFFGEVSLLFDLPNCISVESVGYTHIYTLDKKNFELAVEKFPDSFLAVLEVGEERRAAYYGEKTSIFDVADDNDDGDDWPEETDSPRSQGRAPGLLLPPGSGEPSKPLTHASSRMYSMLKSWQLRAKGSFERRNPPSEPTVSQQPSPSAQPSPAPNSPQPYLSPQPSPSAQPFLSPQNVPSPQAVPSLQPPRLEAHSHHSTQGAQPSAPKRKEPKSLQLMRLLAVQEGTNFNDQVLNELDFQLPREPSEGASTDRSHPSHSFSETLVSNDLPSPL